VISATATAAIAAYFFIPAMNGQLLLM